VTGLTSNPTIFDHAITNSTACDASIRQKLEEGKLGEELFFELAIEDITEAVDLFRPTWEKTSGVDGWVSLEVSPLLAYDTAKTLAAAKDLYRRAGRPNHFVKIPGTGEGLPAIEIGSAVARGRATPVSAFAMSSTSASAAPTSGR
jgi:transaldolase